MKRLLRLWTLCLFATAAITRAQNTTAATLTSLAQAAQQKMEDWEKLAQGLEASIAGLLPCDPKGPAAITEVSRASDVRLSALADYLQAAAQQTSRDIDGAKAVLASTGTLGPTLEAEKMDVALEQAGVDSQFANLTDSAKNHTSLGTPRDALQQVRSELQKRADLVQAGMGGQAKLTAALNEVITAGEARAAVWKEVQVAYEAERARWKAYYAARLARAQTECSIIKAPAPPVRPASKGKQP